MSAVLEERPSAAASSPAAAMVAAVRTLADGPLRDAADATDRGTYPRALMQALGAAGAYRAHIGPGATPGDFASAIRAMAEVSRVCGATGFMVWCQQVCGLYLQQSGNPALMGDFLQRHSSGQQLGATGMSNPMKAYAGIEPLLLKATPCEGGYRVNGTLPWVSNLGADHYAGVLAGVEGLPEGETREVMFLLRCNAPGVELRNCPSFSAMEGTNTWALRLTDHFIGAAEIIADPAKPWIARIRAGFILLQTGFGLGVTQGAIDSMWAVEPALGHVNQYLEDRPDELQAELDALWERIEDAEPDAVRARQGLLHRRARCSRPRQRTRAARGAVGTAARRCARLPAQQRGAATCARIALRGHRQPGHQAPAQGNRAPVGARDAGVSAVAATAAAAETSGITADFKKYICHVCGLIYDEARGDADSGLAAGTRFEDIPEDWACPICGVGKADFEPYVPEPVAARTLRRPTMAPQGTRGAQRGSEGVLIVGAGRAGWAVAQALREADALLPITVLSACSGDVYDKPMISVAVARGLAPETMVRESAAQAAARLNVRLRCGTQAVAIEPRARRLRTSRGTLRYSHLVLAHGAESVLPAVLSASQVWRINDLASYQQLRAALQAGPQRLAIVGAGLVGCELANDLALAGHTINLLDTQPLPLAAQLPAAAGQRLLQAWAQLPISFIGSVRLTALTPGTVSRWRLLLADGRTVDADQVIAATGLRAPTRLARSAGLAFDAAAGGLAVDAHTGATSSAGIYALGDCVAIDGRASRYIEPIARQARGIAAAILGLPAPATSTGEPVLRVKTSAMPMTVQGQAGGAGAWQVLQDDAQALRLQRLGADGQVMGSLVARQAENQAGHSSHGAVKPG